MSICPDTCTPCVNEFAYMLADVACVHAYGRKRLDAFKCEIERQLCEFTRTDARVIPVSPSASGGTHAPLRVGMNLRRGDISSRIFARAFAAALLHVRDTKGRPTCKLRHCSLPRR